LGGGFSNVFGFYPMLLFGSARYYGGIKFIWARDASLNYQQQYERTNIYLFPIILAGTSFGKKLRAMPELSFYGVNKRYDDTAQHGWKVLPIFGLGLQYIY